MNLAKKANGRRIHYTAMKTQGDNVEERSWKQ